MARRRYYRVRRVYPKQKWLPVNNEVGVDEFASLQAGNYVVTIQPITENSTRTLSSGAGNVSSATIVKIGRVRYKGVISGSTSLGLSYIIGIAYIPEGYIINQTSASIGSIGETFFYKHPEWIMCWTRTDYVSTGQGNEISMSSRLKRNLNSGDQIVMFRIAINTQGNGQNASAVRGTVTYVCRTN